MVDDATCGNDVQALPGEAESPAILDRPGLGNGYSVAVVAADGSRAVLTNAVSV